MNKVKIHPIRAVVGIILGLLIFILLIADVTLIGIRTSILRGDGIQGVLSNTGTYDFLQDVLVQTLVEAGNETGIDEETIRDIFTDHIVEETTNQIINGIINDEHVDLTDVAKLCEEASVVIIDASVNKAYDSIVEEAQGEIKIEQISNIDEIKKLDEEFNIDIESAVNEGLGSIAKDGTIVLKDEKVKKELTQAIDEEVTSAIDKIIDSYMEQCNEMIDMQLEQVDGDRSIRDIYNLIDSSTSFVTLAIVFISFVSAILMFIVFLIYRNVIYKFYRKIYFIFTMIALCSVSICVVISQLKKEAIDSFKEESDAIAKIFSAYMDKNISAIINSFMIITIVFAVAAIVCVVLRIVNRKSKMAIDDNDEMVF